MSDPLRDELRILLKVYSDSQILESVKELIAKEKELETAKEELAKIDRDAQDTDFSG